MHQLEEWVFNRKTKSFDILYCLYCFHLDGSFNYLSLVSPFLYEEVIYNWLGTTLIDPITL